MQLNVEKSKKFKKIIGSAFIIGAISLTGCDDQEKINFDDFSNLLSESIELELNYKTKEELANQLCYYYQKIITNSEISDIEKKYFLNYIYNYELADEEIFNKYFEASKVMYKLYNFNIEGAKIEKNVILTSLENVYILYQNPTDLNEKDWAKYFGALEVVYPVNEENPSLTDTLYPLSEMLHEISCTSEHYTEANSLKCKKLNKILNQYI